MGKLVKYAKISFYSLAALVVLVLLGLSLSPGGRRAFSVQTGSMEPAIKTGSLVFVNHVPGEEIATGDVVTYINPHDTRQTITHRVAEVINRPNGTKQFVAKGDANPTADEPISEGRIIGRVNTAIPYLGRAVEAIWHPIGLLLLIYVPAFIVVMGEVRRLAAFYRSQHYELPEMLMRRRASSAGRNLLIAGAVGLVSITVALPVRAAMQSTATLTGNTISVAASEPSPEPEPEPEPPAPPTVGAGDVTLRRAFVACEGDADEATHVQLILYNATDKPINMSDWSVRSGTQKLITFPDETMILGRSLFDAEAPIAEGISYSKGSLSLYNEKAEQIDDISWDLKTTRTCRVRT